MTEKKIQKKSIIFVKTRCFIFIRMKNESKPEDSPSESEPSLIELNTDKKSWLSRSGILYPMLFVILIWLFEGLQLLLDYRFDFLGNAPRSIKGITGIFTSPLVHAGLKHLLSNSLPLLIVGTGLIYFYREVAKNVILMIWIFSGIWVWFFARPDTHIGASGLIYGMVSFLFFSGIIRKDTRLLAISLLVTFLYGSMVWGILPVDQSVSWESHLFGSAAGILCAFYFRNEGPKKPKPQWQIDEEYENLSNETEQDAVAHSAENPAADIQKEDNGQSSIKVVYHFRENANHSNENEHKQSNEEK
ncbi:MAG: rhomboid family intramembrane serine protease [Bacteroidetes bacterium]|nr:MAG: rhomboid family intramembrane serine protease [Bacteroidota bacterium]REK05167.1 MAG: rhomboid family intramembrane serine protease [Bacteroidota bacterium]REK32572.1 MAG: rhomboid family intramembrane serine protease [Bacteroidota bacterium]REK48981.1 MAG: rhomboid family intramembrane serine protease [Bacteroidota bacterium]